MHVQKTVQAFETGGLFLIATPIGNLEDMTIRALNTLKSVDYILAEDTRVSAKLLQHFAIDKRLVSFHEHNQYEKTPAILAGIQKGMHVGLISDAGMPCISDPGAILVKEMVQAELPVTVIPGASAGISLFSVSGLSEQGHFLFHGFLPTKEKGKRDIFASYADLNVPVVYYESPHRILKTLATLATVYAPETQIALGRELTKLHETFTWFTLGEFDAQTFESLMPWKGEIAFVVYQQADEAAAITDDVLLEMIEAGIAEGLKPKAAMKQVATQTGTKANALYRLWQEYIGKQEAEKREE